jgi:hypothetical protein
VGAPSAPTSAAKQPISWGAGSPSSSRRYTRPSNRFSRKLENHAAAVALTYFAYNFIKIHRTLRMTPAMAAGVTDRLQYERRAERAA